MMLNRVAGFLVVLLVAFAALPAAAQFNFARGMGQMQMPGTLQSIMLLRGEAVQKELQLTPKQSEVVNTAAGDMLNEAMGIMTGMMDLSPEEVEKEMPGLMKMIEDKGKELQGTIDKALDEKQRTRVKELSLQQRGMAALEEPEVAAALKLSPDQLDKLKALRDESQRKQLELTEQMLAGGDRQAASEKLQSLRQEQDALALAVLSAEQQAAFEKMKGEKFNFPRSRGFGGLF